MTKKATTKVISNEITPEMAWAGARVLEDMQYAKGPRLAMRVYIAMRSASGAVGKIKVQNEMGEYQARIEGDCNSEVEKYPK